MPIVLVVLDELPQSTLADADGRIDAELFPNFARLARESTWYRNATTVNDSTAAAVPAQLTGEQPRAGTLPTARDHPRSLFTLFERSHELTVIEPITAVCPERLCDDVRPGTGDRLRSLESDLEVVVQQLLLPADLREGLPAVDRMWEGFETDPVPDSGEFVRGANLKRDVLARLARDDPAAGFERAIGALERRGSRPPLVFLHSTLPHMPWRYLPDGRRYPIDGKEYPGLSSNGSWTGPQWQADQGFQRHVLQAQYVDRLLGRLLDALHARDVFDDAVIVVTADHGAAFTTGQPRRPANAANVGVIAPVPFFVKLPGQPDGRVDDRAVRTIDVLPTIAKAAGVRLPWKADGIPADEREADPEAPIDISHMGEPVLTETLGSVLAKRRAREGAEARLLRDGVYAIGPRPDLIGRRVTVPSGAKHVTVDQRERRAAVVPLGPRRGPRARHGARRRRQRARAGDDAGLPRRGTVGLRRARAAIVTARGAQRRVGVRGARGRRSQHRRCRRPSLRELEVRVAGDAFAQIEVDRLARVGVGLGLFQLSW